MAGLALQSKAVDDLTHARLVNWGRYMTTGANVWPRHVTGSDLLAAMAGLVKRTGRAPDELDGERVDYLLLAASFAGDYGAACYQVLLTEYVFGARSAVDRRADVLGRRLVGRPMSRRSYYNNLAEARAWAGDVLRVFAGVDL